MKRFVAWLLAATMAAGILAGCGSKPADSGAQNQTNTGTTTETKAEPQTLALNLGTEPPQLDSALSTDSASFSTLQQVQEGLVRLDAEGKAAKGSGAAADWTISDDGLTYTFTLKDGLKWSDGQPLTAKDFEYAWFRALDPKTASQYNFMLFYIKGAKAWAELDTKAADFATKYEELKKNVALKAVDDKTLTLTLEKPTAYFLALTAFPTFFPQRKDVVEKFGDKYAAEADTMVYSGPFVIKTWTHENEIVLAKNPNYWDAKSVKLEEVRLLMIKDVNTQLNMFEANQLDSAGLDGNSLPQYEGKPGFYKAARPRTWYLEFNSAAAGKPYLANVNIRKAFSLALDREAFVNGVLRDGSVAADGLVPNTISLGDGMYRALAGSMISTKADVAKAQEYYKKGLAELGLDKLPPIEFMVTANDTSKKQAQGVQAMIQQALPGVELNIVPLDFKVRLDKMRKGEFELVLTGWGADYNDPMTFMDMWIKDSPYNDGHWYNAEYDRLVKEAMATSDQKVRLENFKKAEQILMDELPVVPVFYPAVNAIDKPWLKGLVRFPMGASWDLKYAYIEGRTK
jgi:oligopeptide transport system substrate-binding protein